MGARLRLSVVGPFSLVSAEGVDLTPSGQKPRALLALLALSPGLKRSRAWLQDRLWSDRDARLGSGNLRQTLLLVRKALGPHSDVLRADATHVALDPARVEIDAERPDLEIPDDVELLDGLDVADPEFEDWLREKRASFWDRAGAGRAAWPGGAPRPEAQPPPASAAAPLTLIRNLRASTLSDRDRAVEMVADWMGRLAAESGSVRVVEAADVLERKAARAGDRGASLLATFDSYTVDGRIGVQVKLKSLLDGRLVWTSMETLPAEGPGVSSELAIMKLANQAADAMARGFIDDAASSGARRPATLAWEAVRKLFTYDRRAALEADALLEAAFEAEPRAIYLAWRAFVRMTMFVERTDRANVSLAQDADAFIRRALEMDPLNSTVVAIAAQTLMVVSEDDYAGYELANRSVSLNPSNAMGWASFATASIRLGRPQDAHSYALRARGLAEASPFGFWWDMLCCITSTVVADYDRAIYFGEVARSLVPNYRPPLRYLTALYLQRGDRAAAERTIGRLQAIEPDFTPSALLEPSYPVAALRRTALIDLARRRIGAG